MCIPFLTFTYQQIKFNVSDVLRNTTFTLSARCQVPIEISPPTRVGYIRGSQLFPDIGPRSALFTDSRLASLLIRLNAVRKVKNGGIALKSHGNLLKMLQN
jgi:hypothetical protein